VKALPAALRSVSAVELAERLATERRGQPFLVYVDGSHRQRIVEPGPRVSALSIGREARSDISLPWDTEVSRAHAVLERVGDSWTLLDDGLSRNGSYVNGQRVQGRRRLASGDTLLIGGTSIVFVAIDAGVPTTTTTRYGAMPDLTPAQRRVLAALCAPALDGPFTAPASNAEIAAELFVTVDTVKSHLHAMFELFGIDGMPQNRKRAELVRLALERGLSSSA
jgi:pSer/pThr/pTyr-binding forkhead associated (FHA) protein